MKIAILAGLLLVTLPVAAQQEGERALQPAEAQTAFDEGLAAAQGGDLEKALSLFQRACAHGPEWSEAYYYQGACLAGLGRYEESLAPFGTAVEINDSYVLAWAARADSYFRLGRYEECSLDYGCVIERRPDLWLAYGARGEAYLAMGQVEQAVEDLDRTIELKPDAGKAFRVRSQARLLQGKILEAIADAEHSIEFEAENPYAALWLSALRQDTAPLEKFAQAEGWPGLLIGYFRDELTAEALVAKAEAEPAGAREAHLSEAHCWIGLRADLAGEREEAIEHYAACVEARAYFLIEYRWALRRLAQFRGE